MYLFIKREPSPATAGSARVNAKEQEGKAKEKGIEAQSVKPPTPTWTTDALIGDEEQSEKQKMKKKETGSGPLTATL